MISNIKVLKAEVHSVWYSTSHRINQLTFFVLTGPTEQLVSPAPEIYVEPRKPDEDQFLVLACDGIWDVMTNEDLCKFIHHQLTITENLAEVCSAVVDNCLFKVRTCFALILPV